jgi:hypothetical protein
MVRVAHKGPKPDSSQFSTPTNSQILGNKVKKFQIPTSTLLFVRESEVVFENQLIAEFSSMSTQSNQRIQAKHNLNSELEGQIFFEDVLLGMKIGKEGDITRTARKLGSIWVLSGKLYQSMLPSVFFPKAGDLIDTKSIMNQTLVLIPYNGFLNSNRVLPSESVIQDETNLLSANIQNKSFAISDQNTLIESPKKYLSSNSYQPKVFSYDSSLPKGKSKVTTLSNDRTQFDDFSGKYLKIRNFNSKLAKDIILSNSIGSLNLKSIRYKKYGYFLDLCPNLIFSKPRTIFSKFSKNCENKQNFSASKPYFTKNHFFLCNSIEQEFKDINQIKQFFYLQWFPQNYKTKSGGFLFLENNYLNENSTEGQFFWVPEENYKFNKQKLFFPKKAQLKDFSTIESNKAKKTSFSNGVAFIIGKHSRIKNSRFIDSKRILAQKDSRILSNEDSKRALLPEKDEQAEKFLLLDSPSEIKIQTKWIKKDYPIISKSNFQGNPLVFFSNFSGLAIIRRPKKNSSQKNINTAFLKLFKVQTKTDFSVYNAKTHIHQDSKIRECSTIYDGTIRTQKKLFTTPYGRLIPFTMVGSQDDNHSKIFLKKFILQEFLSK